MGPFESRLLPRSLLVGEKYKMKVCVLISAIVCGAYAGPVADPQVFALDAPVLAPVLEPLIVPVPVLCDETIETVTKEVCRIEPKKQCETKEETYTKITGYKKEDCKEVEVCKTPILRRRRSADPQLIGYHAEVLVPVCDIEMQEICRSVPTMEEVTKERELCYFVPNKVCENVEVHIPNVDCSGDENKSGKAIEIEDEKSGEAIETEDEAAGGVIEI